MDEKVRNITLDQKYNTTYLRHHNRPHICKEQYISMKISCICNVLYIFFWFTPAVNEFATYSGSLRNCNPLDQKSTIFFLMPTPCIWIRKILLCNKGLSPTNCLVYSTFCVLKESIMRWLPAIYLLLQITLFDNH